MTAYKRRHKQRGLHMRTRTRDIQSQVYTTGSTGGGSATHGSFPSAAAALSAPLRPSYVPVVRQPITYTGLDIMTDIVTPGYFRKRKDDAILPVNPCNKTYSVRDGGLYGHYYFREPVLNSTTGNWRCNDVWVGSFSVAPPSVPVPPAGPPAQATLTEAIAKWRQQGWDGLTFLAELGKTHSMVTGAIRNWKTYADSIIGNMRRRNKKPRDVVDAIETFSAMWMEGRYGWRLLYYDIKGIQDSLNRMNEGLAAKQRFNATTEDRIETTSNWTALNSTLRYRTKTVHDYVVRGGVLGVHTGAGALALDPLVTAYEVMRWTIVLDWLVSVGDSLRAASPFAQGTISKTWTSRQVNSYSYLEWEFTPGNRTLIHGGCSGLGTSELQTYVREPTTPNYRPKVLDIGGLKLVDASALAVLARSGVSRALRSMAGRG